MDSLIRNALCRIRPNIVMQGDSLAPSVHSGGAFVYIDCGWIRTMTCYFAINRLAGTISQTVHWSLCVGDSSIPLWTPSIWFVDSAAFYFLCHKDSCCFYVFGF